MHRPTAILRVLLLAIFAIYQGYGVYCAVNPFQHPDEEPPSRLVGLVIWKMFAPYDPTDWRVDFEGQRQGAWEPLPMLEWVPRTPDGGVMWEKAMILRTPSFRRPFLRRACQRSGLPLVRVVWRSWPKIPGLAPAGAPVTREKVLATLDCAEGG